MQRPPPLNPISLFKRKLNLTPHLQRSHTRPHRLLSQPDPIVNLCLAGIAQQAEKIAGHHFRHHYEGAEGYALVDEEAAEAARQAPDAVDLVHAVGEVFADGVDEPVFEEDEGPRAGVLTRTVGSV